MPRHGSPPTALEMAPLGGRMRCRGGNDLARHLLPLLQKPVRRGREGPPPARRRELSLAQHSADPGFQARPALALARDPSPLWLGLRRGDGVTRDWSLPADDAWHQHFCREMLSLLAQCTSCLSQCGGGRLDQQHP